MLWLIEYLGGVLLTLFLATRTAWRDAATVGQGVAAERKRIRLITG